MQAVTGVLLGLGPWLWVIAGCLLLAAEAVLPGVFLFWFGLAAVVVGLASLLFDAGLAVQALAFPVLAALFVLVARRLSLAPSRGAAAERLNARADGLVGGVFVLAEPIENGTGRLRQADTLWRVTGPPLPAGTPVRVTAVREGRLVVEAAAAPAEDPAG